MRKKTKKTKNEKVGFDYKKPYYREGRHVKKKGKEDWKKAIKKTSILYSKIEEKSMKKWVAALFSTKIEKITALGPPFPPKVAFLVDLGVPWGPKNPPLGAITIGRATFL